MCQFDVDPFETISSASTYWSCALFASCTSGWYSCWARAVPMALMPPKNGLRVSLLPPPVRPTLRLPPFFGDALPAGDVDGEQASSRPPPARTAPPSTAERRNVRRPRLRAATSAMSLSGRGVVLMGASLLLSACTARTGPRRRRHAARLSASLPVRGDPSGSSRHSCRITDRDAVDGVVMLAPRLVVGKVVAALAVQPHEVKTDLAERYRRQHRGQLLADPRRHRNGKGR